jgi:hypothetical protein
MKPQKEEYVNGLPRWLASLATKQAIAALRPDLVKEIRRRMDRPQSLSEAEAQEWLAQLRDEAKEAARPKMPTLPIEAAERLHRQSAEALVAKQKESVAEHNQRMFRERRERYLHPAPPPTPSGDCVTINMTTAQFWWEEEQFAKAQRELFAEWDECGLYGPQTVDDVVARQERRWRK